MEMQVWDIKEQLKEVKRNEDLSLQEANRNKMIRFAQDRAIWRTTLDAL